MIRFRKHRQQPKDVCLQLSKTPKRHRRRRHVCRKVLLLLLALAAAVNIALSSQRFIFLSVDFSPLIHRYITLFGGPCEWYHRHCVINLCQVAHEGGEGKLYRGTCAAEDIHTAAENVQVFLKSTKISNLRSAYHEAAATKVLANHPQSKLKLIDHGLNFLILTDLAEYKQLDLSARLRTSDGGSATFVGAYMRQVLSQLNWIHHYHGSGYFHLDLSSSNVLQHRSELRFQLIDMSGSRPTTEWKAVLRDSLRRYDRSHLPKLPALVCLLPGQSKLERQYCNHAPISICPEFEDAYALGIQVLRVWYRHSFNREVSRLPVTSFENMVRQHEIDLEALEQLRVKYGDAVEIGHVVSLISQLVENFNTTLVCQ